MKNKIKNLKEIVKIIENAKKNGNKIITTNGCFDIIHPGHVANLEWAKSKGDILIVGINSDESVKKNKSKKRPINKASDRALVLAGLSSVDHVFIFNEENPSLFILKIKPDIHVKGKDAKNHPNFPLDVKAMEKIGGKIMLAPKIKGYGTTKIIDSILRKNK